MTCQQFVQAQLVFDMMMTCSRLIQMLFMVYDLFMTFYDLFCTCSYLVYDFFMACSLIVHASTQEYSLEFEKLGAVHL